ncbi:Bug family tripartite tricarboxylate transporter substrate binding protein [Noviherbaspirillum saxi]|uniref:Tripartite tricarboxylate transporter substrate binding protein n=1 Tax=Noviherbaspirillum saxi TaxID=2320863 RepID=A0A3A3G1J2_9BURK|nr:tripartite tricarboxylate transporter substrate binding protein [Noviherbaspirillum saxi]RJF91943.1 tripartite tricarboxylate transporter substrate binding protein [Noviherbaspirillum saxi]
MKTKLKAALTLAAFALGSLSVAPASAQNYPSKPIKLIAPFAPGGVADVMARLVGDKLSKSLGTPVIVENRPGAGGNIGADVVAKAEPDGYTLLMTSAGILTINGSLYPKLSFDPANSFAPVSLVADMPMVLVVNSAVEAKTLPEFVTYARKNEGKVFFSSPGNGTTPHLGLELLQRAANIKITHVPYKSGAESLNSIVAGQVTGAIETPPSVINQMKSGKLRALAIAGPRRLAQMPDVPTTTEAGIANAEVLSWFGIVAPAKTPPDIIERLSKETAKAVHEPEVEQKLASLGTRAVGNSPAEFDRFIKSERSKWDQIIKQANIKLD